MKVNYRSRLKIKDFSIKCIDDLAIIVNLTKGGTKCDVSYFERIPN